MLARLGERGGVYSVLVRKPEGERPLGSPKRRWKDNIKWIFRTWVGSLDWIELAQYRVQVASTCECGNEPSGSIKCGEFFDWLRTG